MGKMKIVIAGAGYGGLATAVTLQRKIDAANVEITLINKNSYHYETTWLHEAAAGIVATDDVCYDIQPLLKDHVRFVEDVVIELDVASKCVRTMKGVYDYDYLVVGLGFELNDYHIAGVREHSYSLANATSANAIWQRLQSLFEDEEKMKKGITIAVAGAGFTSIEFLGSLTEQLPYFAEQYEFERENVQIVVIEKEATILPTVEPSLREYAQHILEKRGVAFYTEAQIVDVQSDRVQYVKGTTYDQNVDLFIWTAGVKGSSIVEQSNLPNDKGRVTVSPFLHVEAYPEVFVAGDSSVVMDRYAQHPYAPTAQIAMRQGEHIAHNIVQCVLGTSMSPFMPNDKGSVCSLGAGDGIAFVKGQPYTGRKAAVLKKMIDNHALFLVGGPRLIAQKGKFNMFK